MDENLAARIAEEVSEKILESTKDLVDRTLRQTIKSAVKQEYSETIHRAVEEAIKTYQISAERRSRDCYKSTEKRLYNLRTLRVKVQDDKERLEELKKYGPRSRSKSVVVYQSGGSRLEPEEIFEAIVKDMERTIASDSLEIERMEKAMEIIRDDQYFYTITGRYIEGKTDEEIAAALFCDPSTVWRKRKVLVQKLAVRLYGVEAI